MVTKLFTDMRRRDFLAYGSSSALALAGVASGVTARSGVASPLPVDENAAELLAVGYVPGSASLARVEQTMGASELPRSDTRTVHSQSMSEHLPLHPHLIAAQSLPAGDPRFANTGARVSLHGSLPDETCKMYPELSLWSIDVEFNTLHGPLMFHAWCFQNQLVPQSSSPCSFYVPVDETLSLSLSIKRNPQYHTSTGSPIDHLTYDKQQARLEFSLGRETNVPKLQRGVYVIALPSVQTGRLPRWNEYRLQTANPETSGSATELYRCDWRCKPQKADDFAYVKFVVDYHRPPSLSLDNQI